MTKKLLTILGLILISCNPQSNDDCKNAVVFDKMEELSDYNSIFYDDEYTGRVTVPSDGDSSIIEKNIFYENGELVRYESYYDNGNKKMVIPLKCNSEHGTLFYYYPNGNIGYEVPYKLGRINGMALSYDTVGFLIRVVNFKNGEKHGPSFSLNDDRDTVNYKTYDEGKLL